VINFLQGTAVTRTMLGGLTMYLLVAIFLHSMSDKNYDKCLVVGKFINLLIYCNNFKRLRFSSPSMCYCNYGALLFPVYVCADILINCLPHAVLSIVAEIF